MSTEPYQVETGAAEVRLWSSKRLPYEPKGWQLEMKRHLREALLALEGDCSAAVHMAYESLERDRFDLENVLAYNVGAGAFRKLRPRLLIMERAFAPPRRQPANTASPQSEYPISHSYRIGVPERPEWHRTGLIVSWEAMLDRLHSGCGAAQIWRSVKEGIITQRMPAPVELAEAPLGISVQIGLPPRFGLSLFSVLKPLLDGIMAALQRHDGSSREEACRRVAQAAGIAPAQAMRWLEEDPRAVLPAGKVVFPYREGVFWNPADDRLVQIELEVVHETDSSASIRCAGQLHVVETRRGDVEPEWI
ncbi:hypothetical protein NYE40_20190 [Paenibacillus sp. FSL W8-1187]|uniref:hypothetical protein n=1 Tax=Paenibacillus sp. FSL W8-1187 TaxID=2975339 RepID=UPI0030DAA86D